MSDKTTLLKLVDDLHDQIMAARGIEAAIRGLREDPDNGEANEGVACFQCDHANRLLEIKEKLDALRQKAPAPA